MLKVEVDTGMRVCMKIYPEHPEMWCAGRVTNEPAARTPSLNMLLFLLCEKMEKIVIIA